MQTANYIDVLKGAADLAGLDQNNIAALDAAILRNLLSKRLATAWHWQKWPDLCRLEKRYFRPLYDNTATYSAGDEVYFPAKCQYFACINDGTTGTPCADDEGNVDCLHWQAIATSYSGNNYSATGFYNPGDIVYDPSTDAFYWACQASNGQSLYSNLTYWALINPFLRYVSLTQPDQTVIGSPLDVWDKSPRADVRAKRVIWQRTENGVEVISNVPFVWIDFRLPAPRLFGANYSSNASYLPGQQIFYKCNLYDVTVLTNPADTPDTAPDSFAVVQIPAIFKGYMEAGAAADYLGSDDKNEGGDRLHGIAQAYLDDEATVLRGQEGQTEPTVVLTR
jgi:hypothetical protein